MMRPLTIFNSGYQTIETTGDPIVIDGAGYERAALATNAEAVDWAAGQQNGDDLWQFGDQTRDEISGQLVQSGQC